MLSLQCFAFNSKKCFNYLYEGETVVGARGLVSSSQSFSSWGECSMLGSADFQKQLFLAQNLEPLKIDSAKGHGEYLHAYLNLSGCSQDSLKYTDSIIQKNFIKVYGEDLNNPPQKIYEQLETLLNGVCGV